MLRSFWLALVRVENKSTWCMCAIYLYAVTLTTSWKLNNHKFRSSIVFHVFRVDVSRVDDSNAQLQSRHFVSLPCFTVARSEAGLQLKSKHALCWKKKLIHSRGTARRAVTDATCCQLLHNYKTKLYNKSTTNRSHEVTDLQLTDV